MIIRGEITEKKLEHIYDVVRATVKNKSCYYTEEEITELKKDSKNIFLKGGGKNARKQI